jgi:RNA polymerase sigma-70 factor (ECF subfamily)
VDPDIRDGLLAAVPHLRAFAICLCGSPDRADDLVQETLAKALAHVDRFERGTVLNAWLFRILRNQVYTEFRQGRRVVEDPEGTFAARLTALPEQDARLTHQDLLVALGKLRFPHREALLLVGAEGFSYEEAGAIIGVATGTVKSRVHRARVELAKLLGFNTSEDLGVGTLMKAAVRE